MADGAACFRQDSSGPALLRIYRPYLSAFSYRTFTSYGPTFQWCSDSFSVSFAMSFYPDYALTSSVWALPLSLATTRGITVVFFSSAYLDVSVQRVRLPLQGCHASCMTGCPIRISADLRLFATPRSFSQLVTSFFASGSLGILRVLFLTLFFPLHHSFLQVCSMLFSCLLPSCQ